MSDPTPEPVSEEFRKGWLACVAHMDKVYAKYYSTAIRENRKAYREAWETLITNAKVEATEMFGEPVR